MRQRRGGGLAVLLLPFLCVVAVAVASTLIDGDGEKPSPAVVAAITHLSSPRPLPQSPWFGAADVVAKKLAAIRKRTRALGDANTAAVAQHAFGAKNTHPYGEHQDLHTAYRLPLHRLSDPQLRLLLTKYADRSGGQPVDPQSLSRPQMIARLQDLIAAQSKMLRPRLLTNLNVLTPNELALPDEPVVSAAEIERTTLGPMLTAKSERPAIWPAADSRHLVGNDGEAAAAAKTAVVIPLPDEGHFSGYEQKPAITVTTPATPTTASGAPVGVSAPRLSAPGPKLVAEGKSANSGATEVNVGATAQPQAANAGSPKASESKIRYMVDSSAESGMKLAGPAAKEPQTAKESEIQLKSEADAPRSSDEQPIAKSAESESKNLKLTESEPKDQKLTESEHKNLKSTEGESKDSKPTEADPIRRHKQIDSEESDQQQPGEADDAFMRRKNDRLHSQYIASLSEDLQHLKAKYDSMKLEFLRTLRRINERNIHSVDPRRHERLGRLAQKAARTLVLGQPAQWAEIDSELAAEAELAPVSAGAADGTEKSKNGEKPGASAEESKMAEKSAESAKPNQTDSQTAIEGKVEIVDLETLQNSKKPEETKKEEQNRKSEETKAAEAKPAEITESTTPAAPEPQTAKSTPSTTTEPQTPKSTTTAPSPKTTETQEVVGGAERIDGEIHSERPALPTVDSDPDELAGAIDSEVAAGERVAVDNDPVDSEAGNPPDSAKINVDAEISAQAVGKSQKSPAESTQKPKSPTKVETSTLQTPTIVVSHDSSTLEEGTAELVAAIHDRVSTKSEELSSESEAVRRVSAEVKEEVVAAVEGALGSSAVESESSEATGKSGRSPKVSSEAEKSAQKLTEAEGSAQKAYEASASSQKPSETARTHQKPSEAQNSAPTQPEPVEATTPLSNDPTLGGEAIEAEMMANKRLYLQRTQTASPHQHLTPKTTAAPYVTPPAEEVQPAEPTDAEAELSRQAAIHAFFLGEEDEAEEGRFLIGNDSVEESDDAEKPKIATQPTNRVQPVESPKSGGHLNELRSPNLLPKSTVLAKSAAGRWLAGAKSPKPRNHIAAQFNAPKPSAGIRPLGPQRNQQLRPIPQRSPAAATNSGNSQGRAGRRNPPPPNGRFNPEAATPRALPRQAFAAPSSHPPQNIPLRRIHTTHLERFATEEEKTLVDGDDGLAPVRRLAKPTERKRYGNHDGEMAKEEATKAEAPKPEAKNNGNAKTADSEPKSADPAKQDSGKQKVIDSEPTPKPESNKTHKIADAEPKTPKIAAAHSENRKMIDSELPASKTTQPNTQAQKPILKSEPKIAEIPKQNTETEKIAKFIAESVKSAKSAAADEEPLSPLDLIGDQLPNLQIQTKTKITRKQPTISQHRLVDNEPLSIAEAMKKLESAMMSPKSWQPQGVTKKPAVNKPKVFATTLEPKLRFKLKRIDEILSATQLIDQLQAEQQLKGRQRVDAASDVAEVEATTNSLAAAGGDLEVIGNSASPRACDSVSCDFEKGNFCRWHSSEDELSSATMARMHWNDRRRRRSKNEFAIRSWHLWSGDHRPEPMGIARGDVFSDANRRFAASYLKPQQRAILSTELDASAHNQTIRFRAWEAVRNLQLRVCCDTTQDCVLETDLGVKKGTRRWLEFEATCPKGTSRILFECANHGIYQGACGVDDVRLLDNKCPQLTPTRSLLRDGGDERRRRL